MRWCPTAYNRCLTRDLYGYRSHFVYFLKTSQTNIVHHNLACWVAGVSCPILAFKKDFCPSVIFRHEYISCHEFLGEAYLHILSILHRRGVFPFTNYPGIVASVLYYTAEKQMVMWGESDRGGEDWHQWSQAAFGSGTLQRSWSPRHCGDQGSYTEWMCVCVLRLKTECPTRSPWHILAMCVSAVETLLFSVLQLYVPLCSVFHFYDDAAGHDEIVFVPFPSKILSFWRQMQGCNMCRGLPVYISSDVTLMML